jgi:hypothetical protein
MKTLCLTTAALSLGLAACGDYSANEAAYNNETAAYAEGEGNYAAGADYGSTATGSWPAGSRIVVENGVTYRIGPDDVRVALGPDDSQILIENGVRYRVDPGGTRVRIDERGTEIRVEADGVDATVNTQ